MRKSSVLLLVLVLISSSTLVFLPVEAEYQGSITINPDGSMSHSNAPIVQTGSIYSLIGDIVGSITVNSSNIMLDGSGHTISGIILQGTTNVTVKNFAVAFDSERIGIALNDASTNLIANNTVSGFYRIQALNGILFAGIYVKGGNSNTISQNNLLYNLRGMEFADTSHNLIIQNNITSNPNWSPYTTGLYFIRSSNNIIYHNNILNNKYQVQVSDSVNFWDNGYPNGGNYWNDYKTKYPNANMIENSGLGNTPYSIDSQNQDRYPFMQPFNSTLYALQTVPPKILLLSPINNEYNASSVPLLFTVDKAFTWIGFSLDGRENVTVSGNTTISGLPNGLHSLSVFANGTFGNMGASEMVSFTVAVPEPFSTTLLIGSVVAVVAVVGLGLTVYLKKHPSKAGEKT